MKVGGLDRPISNSADQVVIGGQKLLESQLAGALDVRHKQGARAVLPFDINGDTQVDGVPGHTVRGPIGELKERVQRREFFESLHDCPRDDVSVGNLSPAARGRMLVDGLAVFFQ